MNWQSAFILVLMFLAGLALGAFYFIILWKTIRRLPDARNRGQLLIFSFLARTSVVLAALYFLMDGHWERAAAAMAGFIVMRKILTYRLGPQSLAEATQK